MPPTWGDTNGLGASGGEDQGRSQQEEAPISPGGWGGGLAGGTGDWREQLGGWRVGGRGATSCLPGGLSSGQPWAGGSSSRWWRGVLAGGIRVLAPEVTPSYSEPRVLWPPALAIG